MNIEKESLSQFGEKIDVALDQNNVQELRSLADRLNAFIDCGHVIDSDKHIAYYYLGNLMQGLHHNLDDHWDSEIAGKTIIYFRQALYWYCKLEVENSPLLGQITTNLGNQYSAIGRYIEAFRNWNTAIDIPPPTEGIYSFWPIAKAALGKELWYLTSSLYDESHCRIYADRAYAHLNPIWKNRNRYFDKYACAKLEKDESIQKLLEDYNQPLAPLDNSDHLLGEKIQENKYRRWCLKLCLFINPLNDVSDVSCISHDVLCFPTYSKGSDGPHLAASFSSMKSEYSFARFTMYEAIHVDGEHHYSDEGLYLVETHDYSVQGLRVEKIKNVLRIAFSIFDKIAMLLNEYYELGHSFISFNKVWYKKGNRKSGLLTDPIITKNRFLCALYWLSKDVAAHDEDDHRLSYWADDQTKIIYSLRNYIEHGYVRIINDKIYSEPISDNNADETDYAYIVSETQLVESSLRVLNLTREALIYACLAINHSEKEKDKENNIFSVPRETPIVERTRMSRSEACEDDNHEDG